MSVHRDASRRPTKPSRGARPPINWSKTVDRAQKEKVVEELGQIFTDSGVVVVARYQGLTVADMQDYRGRMRDAGGVVRVAKNRLAKIALEGTPCEGVSDLLSGMVVFAYSKDPVTAAKVTEAYAKDNENLVVLGGSMGGSILDPAGVKSVASMPSREELIASIAGCIVAPASGIAGAIGAPASNIAGIVSAVSDMAEAA